MTFLLIPGAGGQAALWQHLAAELHRRGHETIAVDLPADDKNAGFDEYADAAVAAVGDHTGDLVLVAQSLGGFLVPRLCERLPISLIVLVNAMIPAPGETAGDWWEATGSAEARGDHPFDMRWHFFHDVPPDITADAMANNRDQSDTVFAQDAAFTEWPAVPTRVLSGADDRFFPADFQRRVSEQRLGITPDTLPGGHLMPLSQPEKLADYLINAATPANPAG